jgi:hypothetical protein
MPGNRASRRERETEITDYRRERERERGIIG